MLSPRAAFIVTAEKRLRNQSRLPALPLLCSFPVGSYLSFWSRAFCRSCYVERGHVAVLRLEKLNECCNAWAIALGNVRERQWWLSDG